MPRSYIATVNECPPSREAVEPGLRLKFRFLLTKIFYLTSPVWLKLKTFDAISWIDDHGSATTVKV